MLDEIKGAFNRLYSASEAPPITDKSRTGYPQYDFKNSTADCERAHIYTGIFFDGESAGIYYEEPDSHTVRLTADESFDEWLGYITFGAENYKDELLLVADRCGVSWDSEKCKLYITFRRNDMSLSEALMRLSKAMMISGSFRRDVFFKGKY